MTGQPTKIGDHDPLAHDTLEVLREFIDEIGNRGCTGHFDSVLADGHFLKGKNLRQEPERFIEDFLVFPMLEGPLGHGVRPRPKRYAPRWPRRSGVPDFCLTTIPIEDAMAADMRVFGEVKPPNKMKWARQDMRDYLNEDLDLDALAILTDGLEWEMWVRPRGESIPEDNEAHAKVSLEAALGITRDRNKSVESVNPHSIRSGHINVDEFSRFKAESVREIVQSEFDSPENI